MKKHILLVTCLVLISVYSFAQNHPDLDHDIRDINDKTLTRDVNDKTLINDMDYQSYTHMVEMLPYNTQKHSVTEHARFISGWYTLMLGLSRKQKRQVYNEVLTAYQTPNSLLAYTTSDKQRQLIEANRIHTMLDNKLKSILNAQQYLSYQKWANYPENIFAKGW